MPDDFGLIDALPGLIWTARPDGGVAFVSRDWREYTGLSPEAVLGQGWQDAIHPHDRERLRSGWAAIVASGVPGEVEARMRRHDGAYRRFLFRTRPTLEAGGQVRCWWGVSTDVEDRFLAEDALRAQEGHFRSIFDGLPTLITLMSREGDLLVANRHVLEFFGQTLEEIQGRPRGWSFYPGDYPPIAQAWAHSKVTGEPMDIEARQRRVDGEYRWVRLQGYALRDSDGRISSWYFLQTDIDDARRAEAQLAGENRLLEMVAAGRPLAEVLDALCRFVGETAAGCHCGVLFYAPGGETWRHGAGPALPTGYNETMHGRPAHRASGPCGLAASQKAQVVVSDVEADMRWDASGWRDLALAHGLRACWSTPILSQDQAALGALAIYRSEMGEPSPFHSDLLRRAGQIASIAVERSRAESALRRSEAFLLEAQRLSATGSFSWRTAGGDVTWSEQAHGILELESAVAADLQVILSRVHLEDRAIALDNVESARRGGGDFEFETRLVMPDGRTKHVHIVAHRTQDEEGRPEYIGAVQDVTQRRRAEAALSKARSELAHVTRVMSLGALTASIAHEVNQPLSGIVTNANTCVRMLGADPPNIEGALETARRTIRDGQRAAAVIDRLRALFARRPAAEEPVDLNEATREVIALSTGELQRSGIVVRMDLAASLPLVVGDRVQLQQVILNLLLNAADAMSAVDDRPRRLMIRSRREAGSRVRLAVQDAGVGLDANTAERVFDAFYTTKSGGMGIGLAVSRSIIESHQGRLWAAPNVGAGATFAFSIPRRPERLLTDDNADVVGN